MCVAATTLCVTERDNQEIQETIASEEQYKRRTQLGASKEQEVVRAEAGQSEEDRFTLLRRRKPQEQQAVS